MGRRALFHDLSRCISKTPNQILLGYLLRVPGRYPYVQFIQYTTQILTYCTYVPRRTVPTSTEQQRARHDIIVIQLLLSGHASVMISSHPPWRKLRLDSNCPQPERRKTANNRRRNHMALFVAGIEELHHVLGRFSSRRHTSTRSSGACATAKKRNL